MTHPGKEALKELRRRYSAAPRRDYVFAVNRGELCDIFAYVEKLEKITEIAGGSHARIRYNALEAAAIRMEKEAEESSSDHEAGGLYRAAEIARSLKQ